MSEIEQMETLLEEAKAFELAVNNKIISTKQTIQKNLDNIAQSYGYDNIDSCAKYIGYPNKYQEQSLALLIWTAKVWEAAESYLGNLRPKEILNIDESRIMSGLPRLSF